jgi:hypothetical protein
MNLGGSIVFERPVNPECSVSVVARAKHGIADAAYSPHPSRIDKTKGVLLAAEDQRIKSEQEWGFDYHYAK